MSTTDVNPSPTWRSRSIERLVAGTTAAHHLCADRARAEDAAPPAARAVRPLLPFAAWRTNLVDMAVLITTITLADHGRRGHVRITAFYARRARRLMPAVGGTFSEPGLLERYWVGEALFREPSGWSTGQSTPH